MDLLRESSVAAGAAKSVALLAALCVPTAFVVVSTPKSGLNSLVRYAWIAFVYATGKQLIQAVSKVCSSLVLTSAILGLAGLVVIQCCNFLAISPLDADDLIKSSIFVSSDGLFTKVFSTSCLLLNLRGVGTPWQISHLRPFPRFYQKYSDNGKPSRHLFLARQLLIISWQCIFLDIVQISTFETPAEDTEKLFGQGKEFVYLNATAEEWAGRILIGAGSLPARVTLDIGYRAVSVISVLLGLTSPEDWPPLFGSFFDAYTLRGLWSTFWHQFCRWALKTISTFISRHLLRLPYPSRLERYLNITLVFVASGIFHAVIDMYCWQPPSMLPTLAFFGLFAVGIIIEDGVQELCRRITGVDTRNSDQDVPLWHKLVGYVWVLLWMVTIMPWYLYHNARAPTEYKWLLPFSVVNLMGPSVAHTLLIGGGLALKFAVGGEV